MKRVLASKEQSNIGIKESQKKINYSEILTIFDIHISNIAIAPFVAFNNTTAYIQFISKTTIRSFTEKIGKIDQDNQF